MNWVTHTHKTDDYAINCITKKCCIHTNIIKPNLHILNKFICNIHMYVNKTRRKKLKSKILKSLGERKLLQEKADVHPVEKK